LIQYIEEYNAYLAGQSPDIFPKKNKSNNDKLFNLATKKGKLYLGMFPNFEWIDKMIQSINFTKTEQAKIEKVVPVQVEEKQDIFTKKVEIKGPTKKELKVSHADYVEMDDLKQMETEIRNMLKSSGSRKGIHEVPKGIHEVPKGIHEVPKQKQDNAEDRKRVDDDDNSVEEEDGEEKEIDKVSSKSRRFVIKE
jgi:hypothetical protein